jgi:hypothetical protein
MSSLLDRLERRGPDERLRQRVPRYTKDVVSFLRQTKPRGGDDRRGKDMLQLMSRLATSVEGMDDTFRALVSQCSSDAIHMLTAF